MTSDFRTYCAPVKEPPFEHDGHHLTVNRISRSPQAALWTLLNWTDPPPLLTKKGAPRVHQPVKHKDPNLDFYAAQCVHYGMPAMKTKQACKNQLLRAFDKQQQTLRVPASVIEIEERLAAEFKVANEVAKVEYEEDKKRRQQVIAEQAKKRTREEDELFEEVSAASSKRQKKASKTAEAFDLEMCFGKYLVACPYMRSNYGSENDDAYSLSLARLDPNTIYGHFDFGAYIGYLRSTKIDVKNRTIVFHWRGRETGEGESTFADDNVFSITFIDERLFEGSVSGDCFEECEILGELDKSKLFGPVAIRASRWKYQYDQLTESNYEHERVARWR